MARFFTDCENAFVSAAGDAEEYGLKICVALADNELASRVGAAGREYAREHFAYGAYGRPLVDAFEQLCLEADQDSRVTGRVGRSKP